MDNLFQLIAAGIAMGFVYCLVAIEYTLIWNATGLINFAHGNFITLGAYIFAGTLLSVLGTEQILLSLILMTLIMAALGAVMSFVVFEPLSNLPSRLFAVVGTLMLQIILREVVRLVWGTAPFSVKGFLTGTISFGQVTIAKANIYICVISVALLLIQQAFFKLTKTGKAVRCVAENKETAALLGINVRANMAVSVAISSVICGWIGILVIPLFSVTTTMANTISMKGFCAGVIGGFGTIPGAVVGGLFIGILENLYILVGPSDYKDVVSFALMIIVLVISPTGLVRGRFNKRTKALKKG